MKNCLKAMSLLLLFLAGIVSLSLLLTFSKADLSAGRKLFEARCASCHGDDAKGVLQQARNLKVRPANLDLTRGEVARMSAQDLAARITEGKGRMPSHKDYWSPEQIRLVAEYLRSLQSKARKVESHKKTRRKERTSR